MSEPNCAPSFYHAQAATWAYQNVIKDEDILMLLDHDMFLIDEFDIEKEIKDYVYSDEGLEKAGGYGIHGPAGKFIAIINGSYTNVVGLPVHETYELIKEIQRN